MASTIKKGKAKASPIKSSSAKAKSKTKTVKPVSKTKKTISKIVKSKITKPMKIKAAKAKSSEPKKAPVKKVTVKTKVKTKMPIKKLAPKAKPKAKVKTPEPIKTKPVVTKKPIETTVIKPEQKEVLTPPAPKAEAVPVEEYMDEKQLLQFRHMLEQWKRELMEEVDNTITEMKEAGVQADPNDCATQEETFNLELRTRDRERKLLRKIEETLKKIDNEEYGYCDTCGVEIGIRRLEARPTANLCIDCKTLDEIKEKRA